MRLVPLLVLATACAKSAPPPELPSNEASSTTTVESPEPASTSPHAFVPTGNSLAHGPAGTCTVGGETIDKQTREKLVGVTIVVTAGDVSEPMISDETGTFLVHRGSVPEVIHAYYLDLHTEHAFRAAWCGQSIRIEIDQSQSGPIDVR